MLMDEEVQPPSAMPPPKPEKGSVRNRQVSSFARMVFWEDLHTEQDQRRRQHSNAIKRETLEQQQERLADHERALMNRYESLDYDTPNCVQQRASQQLASPSCKLRCSKLCVIKWVLHGTVGFAIGTVAFLVSRLVEALTEWKFHSVQLYIDRGQMVEGYLAYVGISMGFVLVASLLVAYVEPLAAGSGIPELKGYLNGTGFDRLLRVRTLIVKALGVAFSVSGGLIVGKEGPMVHSGAALAANLSHLTCLQHRLPERFNAFRNDRDKRDFASCGCAAGVSAAFGAPIGGVLFALEEASTQWSLSLTWLSFFSALLASYFLNVWRSIGRPDALYAADGQARSAPAPHTTIILSCAVPLADCASSPTVHHSLTTHCHFFLAHHARAASEA